MTSTTIIETKNSNSDWWRYYVFPFTVSDGQLRMWRTVDSFPLGDAVEGLDPQVKVGLKRLGDEIREGRVPVERVDLDEKPNQLEVRFDKGYATEDDWRQIRDLISKAFALPVQ